MGKRSDTLAKGVKKKQNSKSLATRIQDAVKAAMAAAKPDAATANATAAAPAKPATGKANAATFFSGKGEGVIDFARRSGRRRCKCSATAFPKLRR